MKKKGWIIFGIGIGVLVLFGLVVMGSVTGRYNQMVSAQEVIDANWAQVENVLQRRADLVPNLVATVKGMAQQEKDVFLGVAQARSQVQKAGSRGEKINAHQQLGGALSRLLLVVERYPDIKSNQNFIRLQDELAGTENRIAVERKRYNDAIRNYNILIRRFPNNFLAGIFGFEKSDAYFEAKEGADVVPQVDFN